jgi:hypothetical protein
MYPFDSVTRGREACDGEGLVRDLCDVARDSDGAVTELCVMILESGTPVMVKV